MLRTGNQFKQQGFQLPSPSTSSRIAIAACRKNVRRRFFGACGCVILSVMIPTPKPVVVREQGTEDGMMYILKLLAVMNVARVLVT